MKGQDVVYANLSGAMKQQAECIVEAMQATGLKRLIFISSMGIYGEVPREPPSSPLLRPKRSKTPAVPRYRGISARARSTRPPVRWACCDPAPNVPTSGD